MAKIKLFLKPLAAAREETHPGSGAAFLIAALSGERDHELTRECADLYGNVDNLRFAHAVGKECIRGWKGVGDPSGELPCNEENIKAFVNAHAVGIMPWVIRHARSLEHYREAEVEAAKKD